MKEYLYFEIGTADKKEYAKWEYFDCFDKLKLRCHYNCEQIEETANELYSYLVVDMPSRVKNFLVTDNENFRKQN